jgi:2-methylcitrate dehydratase PrpD
VDRLDAIESIRIESQESAVRIIDKTGPLHNPADRDHCLQYMVAVGLLKGDLTADDYEDAAASDPRIDRLRSLMTVTENAQFSADYLDPSKRSIANAVQVFFRDGTATDRVLIEYPIGHRRRRAEGVPLLLAKFERNMRSRLSPEAAERVLSVCSVRDRIMNMPVDEFVGLFVAGTGGVLPSER